MITLIDTSLWIDFTRARSPRSLKQFIVPYALHPTAHLAEPITFEVLRHATLKESKQLTRQVLDPEGFELPVQPVTKRSRLVTTPHRFGLLALSPHPVEQACPTELLRRRDRLGMDIQAHHDYFSQCSLRLAFGVSC
jgi:hypothetical protein